MKCANFSDDLITQIDNFVDRTDCTNETNFISCET